MTTPGSGNRPADAGAAPTGDGADVPFDPYRFGAPEHPVPPEFAPPGYVADPSSASPEPYRGYPPNYPGSQPPYGGGQYGGGQQGGGQQGGGQQGGGQYGGGQYGGGRQGGGHAPAPPSTHGYPQPGNGKATTALVCGIASILMCWTSFLDIALVVVALVFGFIALSEARHGRSGRGLAIGGIVCAVVGGLLATLLTVAVVRASSHCAGITDQQQQRQCIVDRIVG